ncbi:Peptidase C48, SUMO/Sentrin/Ubl1 [Ascosphaera apis ARSEF 7405]|uniref:Peptidase C48, SUMO/Sentrin/Ubl1 n=1 Tax=Ascosphaera apis ARSEF 7405 TaxID=392613 RepID=A0A167USW6_9EURO|nr:Peptidase C48, SUMO/Sentrin/Ubl1 [Ascosphaera apis ARSEF 7405]
MSNVIEEAAQAPNPDLRLVCDPPRLEGKEISISQTCDGQRVTGRTLQVSDTAREQVVSKWTPETVFKAVDWVKTVKTNQQLGDHLYLILQMVSEPAPFRCSCCVRAGWFSVCTIPDYSTSTTSRACTCCWYRRVARDCDHNPDKRKAVPNRRELRLVQTSVTQALSAARDLLRGTGYFVADSHGRQVEMVPASQQEQLEWIRDACGRQGMVAVLKEDQRRREKYRASLEVKIDSLKSKIRRLEAELAAVQEEEDEDESDEMVALSEEGGEGSDAPDEAAAIAEAPRRSGRPNAGKSRRSNNVPAATTVVSRPGHPLTPEREGLNTFVESSPSIASPAGVPALSLRKRAWKRSSHLTDKASSASRPARRRRLASAESESPSVEGSGDLLAAFLQSGAASSSLPIREETAAAAPPPNSLSAGSLDTAPAADSHEETSFVTAPLGESREVPVSRELADEAAAADGDLDGDRAPSPAVSIDRLPLSGDVTNGLPVSVASPATPPPQDFSAAIQTVMSPFPNARGESILQLAREKLAAEEAKANAASVAATAVPLEESPAFPDLSLLDVHLVEDLGRLRQVPSKEVFPASTSASFKHNALLSYRRKQFWQGEVPSWGPLPYVLEEGDHVGMRNRDAEFEAAHVMGYAYLLLATLPTVARSCVALVDPIFTTLLREEGFGVAAALDGYAAGLEAVRRARVLLFPIHDVDHWLFCAVDKEDWTVVEGDSMWAEGDTYQEEQLAPILEWLQHVGVCPPSGAPWTYLGNIFDQQEGDHDCGIYLCAGMRTLLLQGRIDQRSSWTVNSISKFRKHLLEELSVGTIDPSFQARLGRWFDPSVAAAEEVGNDTTILSAVEEDACNPTASSEEVDGGLDVAKPADGEDKNESLLK